MSDDDADPVDEINFALWGDVDEGARRAGRRVADEGADGPARRRVAADRHLREVLERIDASRTPPELKSWLMRTVGEHRGAASHVDVSWISALPMAMPTTMRAVGAAADRLFACAFDGGELRAHVQFEENGAACAVTGRLLGADKRALVARPVALFVDKGPRDSTITDERGEFTFDARRGSAFGVRVGMGQDAVHVALIELGAGKDVRGTRS